MYYIENKEAHASRNGECASVYQDYTSGTIQITAKEHIILAPDHCPLAFPLLKQGNQFYTALRCRPI